MSWFGCIDLGDPLNPLKRENKIVLSPLLRGWGIGLPLLLGGWEDLIAPL
ncbi:MAG: hypothetical protein CLLPBCKN_007978 [Chroococcidiopsis cubana SAG 39.79]|nr:hypothetical protein [Chroococcidiopsis cubana SAG 39.79]